MGYAFCFHTQGSTVCGNTTRDGVRFVKSNNMDVAVIKKNSMC